MLRISAEDLANLCIAEARRQRWLGILSIRSHIRRFHFDLCQRLVKAAHAVVKGEAYLLKGPSPDLCLDPGCLQFVREGHDCPHETGRLLEVPSVAIPTA